MSNKSVFRSLVSVFMTLVSSICYAAPQFLDFPVSGYGAFSPSLITSVVDHDVPHDLNQATLPFGTYSTNGPFGYSGAVLSFTGELFVANAQYPTQNLGCYPKPANANQTSVWSVVLRNAYTGTSGCTSQVALNYDNHPGYDYGFAGSTPVYPAASGNIIFTKCIRTFSSNQSTSCDSYGAVAIDHGNGFVTQYLHMKNVYYGAAVNGQNQPINGGYVTSIGQVWNTSPTPVGVHLHFEVLQRKATAVNNSNYYARENYMIVDPYGYKPGAPYADNLMSKPGCLWKVACQY